MKPLIPPAELLVALDEIEALDFPKREKVGACRLVVELLAKKEPQAALTRLVDRLDDYGSGFTNNLNDAFEKWLTDDSAAATAWFDAQISSGSFDARGVDGVSRPRAEFEGKLISKLLLVDPAGARRRLAAIPANSQFKTMQSVSIVDMAPTDLQNYAELVRSGQPAFEPGLVIGQAVELALFFTTGAETATLLDQMGATDVERAAVLKQNPTGEIQFIRDRKPFPENFYELRQWFTAVSPDEDLSRLTGRALANERNGRTFDEAAQLALDYGGGEVLATFLETKNPSDHPEEVRKLADLIDDPERRAHILRPWNRTTWANENLAGYFLHFCRRFPAAGLEKPRGTHSGPTRTRGSHARAGTSTKGKSRRPRERIDTDADGTIRDALDFLRWARSTDPEKSVLNARERELFDRFSHMKGADLVALAAALCDIEKAGGKHWEPLIAAVLAQLSTDYPRDALALFRRLPQLAGKLRDGELLIARSLGNLATEDPAAAIAWLRAADSPLATEAAKRMMIERISRKDPVRAFKTASELEITDLRSALSAIVSSGEVSEPGGKILEGLRWYLDRHGEETKDFRRNLLAGLAMRLNSSGFQSLQKWMAANPLTQDEVAAFATGLSHGGNYAEAAEFLPWISQNLPPGLAEPEIARTIVGRTGQDSLGEEKWLAVQPEGGLRDTTAAAFAKQIAPRTPKPSPATMGWNEAADSDRWDSGLDANHEKTSKGLHFAH